ALDRRPQRLLQHCPAQQRVALVRQQALRQRACAERERRILQKERQRARQAGAGEEALALLEELGERLAQQPTLVVLDDVHRADAAETAALFALLEDLMARKRVRLLLVGRTRPAAGDWPALPGLCEEEAHLLWGGEALLPADQWQALYTAVGGLPQPLRLAAAAYRRAGDLARPSDWSAAVEDWARDALWGQLDPAQRRALAVVCHIESRALPVSPDAVCGALGVDRSALESLRGYGLLAADEAARVLPVLRVGALQELRADAELRVAIEDLAEAGRLAPSAPCDAAPALATAAGSTMSEPPVMATAAPPPPGLELLARVRRALLHSAAYLQSRRDDEARVLLRELALLQSMLPDPGGPRAGRRGRRSPAGRSRGLALQRG
ncbi:MAG TPA: hypothetical protein VNL77_20240, partial [Roseiflexaceae bacterium]|nr:hypothetical protein [Roseiflexaceae bacterium]